MDSKLKWSSHIARAAQKGGAQLEALSRLVGSTWGLTFARARNLYTVVIRPTITYGCGIWAGGEKGEGLQERTLRPLAKLRNKCLRRITGAYKRTPAAALEKDSNIPPAQLYTKPRHTSMPSAQTSPQQRWPYGNDASRSATKATQVADDNSKRRLHRERPFRPGRGKHGRKRLGRRTSRKNANKQMARLWAKPDAGRLATG